MDTMVPRFRGSKWWRCSIPTCSAHTWNRTSNIAGHLFPNRAGFEHVRAAWVQVVRDVMNNQTWEPARKDKLCSRHFLPSDYQGEVAKWTSKISARHLKWTSIPTVNLYPEVGGIVANGQAFNDNQAGLIHSGPSNSFIEIKIEPDFEFEVPVPDRDPLLPLPPPPPEIPTFTPRSCPMCRSYFKSQTNYENHMRLHWTDELGHKCGKCGVSLPQQSDLDAHVASGRCKQKEQPEGDMEECDKCGESFHKVRKLKAHKANRIECFVLPGQFGDTFRCPVSMCWMPFPTSLRLRRHLVKDHATWKGACLICGVKSDCSIYDHLVQEHGSPGGAGDEDDVVRVKNEVILEDVVIKTETD